MPGSGSDPLARALRELDEVLLEVRGEKFIPSSQVVFIRYSTETKKTTLHTKDNQAHETRRSVDRLERHLPGRFLRVGRFYLVNLDEVHEVSGREGDFRLHFRHNQLDIPVSSKYEKNLRQALGVHTLEHLTPFNPFDKFLRQHELIDFGARELPGLDRTDEAAKEAFRHRWDIKGFSFEQIRRYFKQVSTEKIDTVRLIRNLIWQKYRWIVWGIDEKFRGDIRTLWYQVEAALEHHPELIGQVSAESYYEGLNYLIVQKRIFKYRDIGFIDDRSDYRKIGEKRPAFLLASEKIGHFYRLEEMAEPYGITVVCTKGQVPHITIEYLAEELAAAGVELARVTPEIFMVTDFDWAGKSIGENFAAGLVEDTPIEAVHFHPLVKLEHFTDQEIVRARTPGARFTRQEGRDVPYEETTQEDLAAAKKWFEGVGDPRLLDWRDIGGQKVYTIWKVSVDALPWRKVEAVFHEQIQAVLGAGPPPAEGGHPARPGRRQPSD